MSTAHDQSDEPPGWRFLIGGVALLALPWVALGLVVVFVMPMFPKGLPLPDWTFFACVLCSLAVSVVGAGLVLAAGVIFISDFSENRRL